MNYLAHIFLARHSDAAMVGALLGDFVRPDLDARYPPEIRREIRLHRRIDSFTDGHPIVRSARRLFPDGRRRFSGIILDVLYDHLLSTRWERYSRTPREALISRFYGALQAHQSLLPPNLQAVAPLMIQQDWLGGYADYAGVETTVRRISRRLSRNGELLRDGLIDARAHHGELTLGFDAFFPELIQFVEVGRAEMAAAQTAAN